MDPALLTALSSDDREILLEFAERGRTDVVRLLLKSGFEIETSREVGTALHIAAWFGHIDTVRVLLAHGASLSVCNAYGGTPWTALFMVLTAPMESNMPLLSSR
ncbi:Ankyrin repeat protein [compost metagenome]